MKFKIFAVLLLLVFMADADVKTWPYPVEGFSRDGAFPVQRVLDGDTVEIRYGGNPVTVRLIGVDTPETVHPTKPVQAFGKEASAFTRNLLMGESVYLRFDEGRTDKYGRLLAYLYRAPDGLFVNLEIVRQGYGHAYTQFPFEHMELFRHYEQRARMAKKGLWESANVKEPEADRGVPSIDEMEVYTTASGTKYHREGCGHLRRSQKPISLKDARKRYSPCSICKPPK